MGYLVLFFTEPNKIDVTMLLGIHLSFSRNTPKRLMRHFTRNSMDLFHRDN